MSSAPCDQVFCSCAEALFLTITPITHSTNPSVQTVSGATQGQIRYVLCASIAELYTKRKEKSITVSGRVVVNSRIDQGILQVADEIKANIIVMGTRGLSPLRGAIMGSVSHALIEKATCPVLIVK